MCCGGNAVSVWSGCVCRLIRSFWNPCGKGAVTQNRLCVSLGNGVLHQSVKNVSGISVDNMD